MEHQKSKENIYQKTNKIGQQFAEKMLEKALDRASQNKNADKYFNRFTILITILIVIVAIPYLINGSARIIRSLKNLKRAIKE